MKIKLNADLLKYKKGSVVDLDLPRHAQELGYWNRRLKDSKIDNCVEIINEVPAKSKKKKENPKCL